jgi:prepilin-type N-terminal cleavage/methylation domain-containing protein
VARRRAFTLIELLVSIGIIGILIALTVPALRSTRSRGSETVVLSNLRGIASTFSLYNEAYDGRYPWVPQWSKMYIVPPEDGMNSYISTDYYWVLSYAWPAVFHDLAPWREHYMSWRDPPVRHGKRPWLDEGSSKHVWPSYMYCRSFQARPIVWASGGPLPPEGNFNPTRVSEVRFPSSKALMFDKDLTYLHREPRETDARGVLAADGSASMRFNRDAKPPAQNRLDESEPTIYHDTPDGVLGRDF